MSRNNKRGGGRRRFDAGEKELIVKEDGQEYAQVSRMLGNGRIEASCFDGIVRVCHIRGTMRKKVWINAGDIVLVGIRDFQDNKGDVILRYTPDEARKLKARGELPDNLEVDKGDKEGNEEDAMFDFGDL